MKVNEPFTYRLLLLIKFKGAIQVLPVPKIKLNIFQSKHRLRNNFSLKLAKNLAVSLEFQFLEGSSHRTVALGNFYFIGGTYL